MKGSLLWRLMYIFCALAGCLAGYGIFTLTSRHDIKPNTNTKDNTLVRESGDSVFFDGETFVVPMISVAPMPTDVPQMPLVTENPREITPSEITLPENPDATVTEMPPEPAATPVVMQEETEEISQDGQKPYPDMPSLGSQWANAGLPVPTTVPVENAVTETITYPAEIFGQVPVINRSDTYVSYFEFAYDLITMLEPEVKQRGLNMNSLLTKFAVRALFCGVDIEQLDINAPIPRRLAALCLWLAAQVLGEDSSSTSSKSAQEYITDIGGCSSAEKKAVAYMYEQGILKGYQTHGQRFYPDAGLKTESESTWLSGAKQCWK